MIWNGFSLQIQLNEFTPQQVPSRTPRANSRKYGGPNLALGSPDVDRVRPLSSHGLDVQWIEENYF